MNRKAINLIIAKKVNDWVSSIKDDSLQKEVQDNCIVTGGSIVSLLSNEKPKDYDIYIKSKDVLKRLAQYYISQFGDDSIHLIDCSEPSEYEKTETEKIKEMIENKRKKMLERNEDVSGLEQEETELIEKLKTTIMEIIPKMDPDRIRIMIKSNGIASSEDYKEVLESPSEDIIDAVAELDSMKSEILEEDSLEEKEGTQKEKYRPIFFSSNAITLSDRIQLIVRFYGDPEEIHKNYDYVHCTNYWTFSSKLILKQEALESFIFKQLVYVGSKYPLCSVIRSRKFIKRGWNINAGQYLKMLYQVSQLDLNDPWVLEDQLIGVDSTYFNILIDALKTKAKNEPAFILTTEYLTSIIDKIF